MLIRELRRLLPFFGPLLVLVFVAVRSYDKSLVQLPAFGGAAPKGPAGGESKAPAKPADAAKEPAKEAHRSGYVQGAYQDLFSVSTSNKKYFPVVFERQHSINPNAIPHPTLNDTWIIVSQLQRSEVENTVWFAELVCNAKFKGSGELACIDPPFILPISTTPGGSKCVDEVKFFQFSVGPHDARIFYGPSNPFVMWGSTSEHTCFGQWITDFRTMMDWPFELFHRERFRKFTELQRPEPYGRVEKNFFIFWDKNEEIYAHFDVTPKRVFSKLSYDGSVGPNLGTETAATDDKCLAKYLPKILPETESIHQATNSLSITMCKRSDPKCKPDDTNTFIINIFQHKKYYSWHSVYEPYVMLFNQAAPFAIHGISSKPLWISGRGKPGQWKRLDGTPGFEDQTQMFYVTSLSWKQQGQRYHGYIDDIMFVFFGIEDSDTGGIDVVAGDLLSGLGLCSDA